MYTTKYLAVITITLAGNTLHILVKGTLLGTGFQLLFLVFSWLMPVIELCNRL